MLFTVMPSGPSSRASVFAQPITPGRTTFESARFSIGSRTELDSMLMIRPASLLRRWRRQRFVRPHGRDEQQRDRRLERLLGHLEGGAARRAAAVVDEDVDAAEGLDGAPHQPLAVLRVGDVAADRQAADPLGLALEHLAPAGEHRDVGALLGERFGDREADPLRGAADDRGPVLEP